MYFCNCKNKIGSFKTFVTIRICKGDFSRTFYAYKRNVCDFSRTFYACKRSVCD